MPGGQPERRTCGLLSGCRNAGRPRRLSPARWGCCGISCLFPDPAAARREVLAPPLFLLLHVLFHGLRLIFRRQVGNRLWSLRFPPAFKLSEAVFYAIDAGVQATMKAALVRAVKNPLFVFPANMRRFPHGLFLLRLRATHVPAVVTVHRRPWAYSVHDNKHFLFLRRGAAFPVYACDQIFPCQHSGLRHISARVPYGRVENPRHFWQ